MSNTVLVVEDEPNLLMALKYTLEQEGYDTLTAVDGESGLRIAQSRSPDLVILDVMLPSLDGFEVCRILRRQSNIPILMLTARGEEVDRVVGLELGADDYVTKPFNMRELLARVRNMLRRSSTPALESSPGDDEVIRSGNLKIDLASHSITLDDEDLAVKPREFSLIVAARRKQRACIYKGPDPGTAVGARLHRRLPHGRCSHTLASREDRTRAFAAPTNSDDSWRWLPIRRMTDEVARSTQAIGPCLHCCPASGIERDSDADRVSWSGLAGLCR